MGSKGLNGTPCIRLGALSERIGASANRELSIALQNQKEYCRPETTINNKCPKYFVNKL